MACNSAVHPLPHCTGRTTKGTGGVDQDSIDDCYVKPGGCCRSSGPLFQGKTRNYHLYSDSLTDWTLTPSDWNAKRTAAVF